MKSKKNCNAYNQSCDRDSQEYLDGKQEKYLSSRGLISATRIINQHLFGLQNLRGGKGIETRLSMDSIDSKNSLNFEQQRRSKSILKKTDSSHQKLTDPETEKLISDSSFGRPTFIGNEQDINHDSNGLRGNSNPSKISRGTSPPLRQSQKYQCKASIRNLGSKSGVKTHALPVKFVRLTSNFSNEKSKKLKSSFALDNFWEGDKRSRDEEARENKYKDRLEVISCIPGAGDVACCGQSSEQSPLYICPPPPIDDTSPTEETKLIHGPRSKPLS